MFQPRVRYLSFRDAQCLQKSSDPSTLSARRRLIPRPPQVESESMFRVRQAAQYSFLPWTEIEGRQCPFGDFRRGVQEKAVRF